MILIIGDSCIDVFQYGKSDRICPEAPVPVFHPTKETKNGGMALNVQANLMALGINCDIITNKRKPIKTRYVDEISNQMLLRIDEYDEIEGIEYSKLLTIDYDKYDIIVVSDYNKGFLSEDDIEYIAGKQPIVFLDTKKKIGKWAAGIDIIKINEKEFQENGEWLTKEYDGDLVVTLGRKGAKHWFHEIPIEKEHDVRDLSGAGDTFLAAIVADFIKNNDICKAIEFANKCASWVVTQKGVVTVDLNKIEL